MTSYRLKYERGENVRFLSHLDMLQLFSRAVRRSKLPIGYSEGFNPHPLFVFGMPLPVGVTSQAEYVDMEMTETLPEDTLLVTLNDHLPEGVRILSVEELAPHAPNIMKSVISSAYRVKIGAEEPFSISQITEALQKAYQSQTPLIVAKRSKSGTKETDIRPMIFGLFVLETEDEIACLKVTTAAGNTTNLRPELAVQALAEQAGVAVRIEQIHRLALLRDETD